MANASLPPWVPPTPQEVAERARDEAETEAERVNGAIVLYEYAIDFAQMATDEADANNYFGFPMLALRADLIAQRNSVVFGGLSFQAGQAAYAANDFSTATTEFQNAKSNFSGRAAIIEGLATQLMIDIGLWWVGFWQYMG